MSKLPTAPQEMRFLRHVAAEGPLSVGQVAATLGAELGLSRSTVLTLLERLRRKGHLRRKRVDGVYVYASVLGLEPIQRASVGQFVEKALGGAVHPFAAWLAERGEVSDAELAELEAMVATLRSRRETP